MSPTTLIIALVLICILIAAGMTALATIRGRRLLGTTARARIHTEWQAILAEQHPTARIIRADKLLDYALRQRGYTTGSIGDKLKKSKPLFTNISDIWAAHKIRNRIAHELGYHPTPALAEQCLRQFYQGLRDLGL